MSSNLRPSERAVRVGGISVRTLDGSASQTATGPWVDAGTAAWVRALLNCGDFGSGGSVVLSWEQAKDTSGTGAKALTAGDFASKTVNTDFDHVEAEERSEKLDINNGFSCVRPKLTSAVANAPVALELLLVDPIHQS